MSPAEIEDGSAIKARRRKLIISIIVGSIAVHLLAAAGAGIWIVARYFTRPPATFEVRKDLRLPVKEREHKMNMAEFDALTPKPALQEKIASLRPTEFALPDLPKVPLDQMLPLDPSELISDQVSSLVGVAGMGAGGTGIEGMGGKGTGFSFFGIQSQGRRVVLLFDVSLSVVNKAQIAGVPMAKIKEETIRVVDGLSINTRFGIIQFTQNYKPFQPELIPATEPNKESARAWVRTQWTEEGTMSSSSKSVLRNATGVIGVLEAALKMQPDAIFLISDGSFQRGMTNIDPKEIEGVLKDHEKSAGAKVPVNFIGFELKADDRNALRRIFRRTGGDFVELDAG